MAENGGKSLAELLETAHGSVDDELRRRSKLCQADAARLRSGGELLRSEIATSRAHSWEQTAEICALLVRLIGGPDEK